MASPYLVLHLEEFAWPRMLPPAPVGSYPTISPITFRLVCFLLHLSSPGNAGLPAVNRLDALRCSDFPPSFFRTKAITGSTRFTGRAL